MKQLGRRLVELQEKIKELEDDAEARRRAALHAKVVHEAKEPELRSSRVRRQDLEEGWYHTPKETAAPLPPYPGTTQYSPVFGSGRR